MLGVAFNVKLLESVVALPGLFVLAWLGLPRTSEDSRGAEFARRLAKFAAAAAVYVVVALLWLGATLLFPAHERPYAIGSTNGSAWNAAFVFNGTERLSGKTAEVGTPTAPHGRGSGELTSTGTPITPPSPTRLLARSGQLPAKWLGWEALAALLLGIAVVISVLRGKAGRVQRAAYGDRRVRVAAHRARLVQRDGTLAPTLRRELHTGRRGHVRDRRRAGRGPSKPRATARAAADGTTRGSAHGKRGSGRSKDQRRRQRRRAQPERAARAQRLPARPSGKSPLRAGGGILDERRLVDRAGPAPGADADHLQRHPLHDACPS